MSRRLSNIEWSTFLNEVDVDRLGLPQWGGIVQWRDMNVLVYIGPTGEVFTTDVTDLGANAANFNWKQDALSGYWWAYIPRETMGVVVQRAAQTRTLINSAGDLVVDLSETVGEGAGALLGPLLGELTLPLIAVAVVAIIVFRK